MRRRHGPPPVKTLDESFSTAVDATAKRMVFDVISTLVSLFFDLVKIVV